jgi:hypothetical protein
MVAAESPCQVDSLHEKSSAGVIFFSTSLQSLLENSTIFRLCTGEIHLLTQGAV